MTVAQFFAVTKGNRQFSFSEADKPLCGQEFFHKYRSSDVWNSEIDCVDLIPNRKEENGLWFDAVICLIRLK